MHIDNALIKEYEKKSFKELADAPVYALQGVSEATAQKLKEALKIKTIKDLANNKFVQWAQAITILAKLS
jgi:nucleotidyltransferase/DNA polymerase involved in DNA repair